MDGLTEGLLVRLRERASTPRGGPEVLGTYDDWAEAAATMDALSPGSGDAFAKLASMATQFGWPMKPAHLLRAADGSLSASTDLPPLEASPPSPDAAWDVVERTTGHPVPRDLRDLYAVADGGFGPGAGEGLMPVHLIVPTYEDLRRRGPGYTAELEWPAALLPIADTTGPVSYDLGTGRVVAFNDDWADDGRAIADGFGVVAPSLAAWLEAWLEEPGGSA